MTNKPISELTETELSEFILGILSENTRLNDLNSLIKSITPSNESDITGIEWVSANCNYQLSTIRSKVSRETIPYFSRNKPLQFSKKAIIKWMEQGRPKTSIIKDFIPKRKTTSKKALKLK
jgi:hypothetical protein